VNDLSIIMAIELTLVWAIIVTVGLVILFGFLIRNHMKYKIKLQAIKFESKQDKTEQQVITDKEKVEMQEQFKVTVIDERKDARESSRHTLKGKIAEHMSPLFPEFFSKYEASDARFLGSPIDYIIFKYLSEFNNKTKAGDIPIDVVLVEVKSSKKAPLTEKEKAVRIAVEEGRVSFDVIRQNIEPQKETTPNKLDKKDSYMSRQKEMFSSAYRKWTKNEEEFLIKYWKDESSKRNRDEMIKELSEKLKRNIGGIKSRLAKHGLIEDDYGRY